MKIKTSEQLINEFNRIADLHRGKGGLDLLSDYELTIYIAGRTLNYGRSLEDSLENAKYQMKNKEKAIKLFSTKETDLMGMTL